MVKLENEEARRNEDSREELPTLPHTSILYWTIREAVNTKSITVSALLIVLYEDDSITD